MTMKIAKWTVDKQEGMGGTSGHFITFSAGFCLWKHTGERTESPVSWIRICFINCSKWDFTIWSIPEHYAGPGAPRLFWPCAGVLWYRWSAEWSHMFPYRLHYPGVGLSRSVSVIRKRSFCSDKEKTHKVTVYRPENYQSLQKHCAININTATGSPKDWNHPSCNSLLIPNEYLSNIVKMFTFHNLIHLLVEFMLGNMMSSKYAVWYHLFTVIQIVQN